MRTYDLVKMILENNPKTRSSDNELLWDYACAISNDLLYTNTNLFPKKDFMEIPFETVTRCRRKIQELHPELRANPVVKAWRNELSSEKGTHIYRQTTLDQGGAQAGLEI
jgi:hypothetical protein